MGPRGAFGGHRQVGAHESHDRPGDFRSKRVAVALPSERVATDKLRCGFSALKIKRHLKKDGCSGLAGGAASSLKGREPPARAGPRTQTAFLFPSVRNHSSVHEQQGRGCGSGECRASSVCSPVFFLVRIWTREETNPPRCRFHR